MAHHRQAANIVRHQKGDEYVTPPIAERSPRPSQNIPGRCSEKGCPYQPAEGCGEHCRRCWQLLFGPVPELMRRRGNQMREAYEREVSMHGVHTAVRDNPRLKMTPQAARDQWRQSLPRSEQLKH